VGDLFYTLLGAAAAIAGLLAVLLVDQAPVVTTNLADRMGKPIGDKEPFDVYGSYDPRGFMGDTGDITIEEEPNNRLVRFRYDAHGREPHEWEYKYLDDGTKNAQLCKFAGVMFLDGNWGKTDGGYDLRGKRKLGWQARSLSGMVNVQFLAGGVAWVWDKHQ
jgi:hypothetical protein